MKVFRLEHRFHCSGPYNSSEGRGVMWGKWKNPDTTRHPPPDTDSKLCQSIHADADFGQKIYPWSAFNYGFESVKQFRAWFYDDAALRQLDELGFMLRIYEVPKAFYGNSQACFPLAYHVPQNIIAQYELDALPAEKVRKPRKPKKKRKEA